MIENAFQRRMEIQRMLLSGKRLTIAKLKQKFGVSRTTIRRDFDAINESLPLIAKSGCGGGYFLMEGVGKYQNSLTREQLECLDELLGICSEEQREILCSIIKQYGPYTTQQ